jgi:hypothetical protein
MEGHPSGRAPTGALGALFVAVELIDRLMQATPNATCTGGLAELREDDTVELLAERARQALVLAKRRGGVVLAS